MHVQLNSTHRCAILHQDVHELGRAATPARFDDIGGERLQRVGVVLGLLCGGQRPVDAWPAERSNPNTNRVKRANKRARKQLWRIPTGSGTIDRVEMLLQYHI